MSSRTDDPEYHEILSELRLLHEITGSPGIDISASGDGFRRRDDLPRRHAKEEGALAEKLYEYVAGKNGIHTARTHGDILPFDNVSIAPPPPFRLTKVQVKCTSSRDHSFVYKLDAHRAGGKAYKAGEIDYIAGLLVPEDDWYIIPFDALRGRVSLYVHPRDKTKQSHDCNVYRERWDLLR